MTERKSTNLYVGVCIAQSILIIALAFYMGREKTTNEELLKENERNQFALQMNASEMARLKEMLDTCGTKK